MAQLQSTSITGSLIVTGPTTLSSSISSSYADTASIAINTANADAAIQSTFATQSLYATQSISSSYADIAVTANNISFVPATATSASWVSSSVKMDSASYADNAGTAYAINFVPVAATSASWVSASVKITTADTASYVAGANVIGTVSSANQSIYATQSLYATQSVTASYAIQTLASTYTFEPQGFPNQTDSTISASDGNRTIYIYPTNPATGYDLFIKGVKYNITTTQSMVLPATPGGVYYVYIDANTQTINTSSVEWDFDTGNLPAFIAYWDGTRFSISDERHGIVMDWSTHHYLHDTMGPRYASGMAGIFTGSNGTFIVDPGSWFDEDLENGPTSAQTTARIAYYSASMICLESTNSFRNGAVQWNNISTGALTTVASNNFGAFFVYAVNGLSTSNQLVSVIGQRVDGTLNNAIANNTPETLVFGNFPYREAKLLYRVIVKGDGVWQNTTDYRSAQYAGSTFTPTAHGSLSGLTNDDHQQYLLLAGRTGGQTVIGGITGSLQGTASYALSASKVEGVVIPEVSDLSNTSALTIGYKVAMTSSNADFAVLIGSRAAQHCPTNTNAVMLGSYAGFTATGAASSVLLGKLAGAYGDQNNSVIIGHNTPSSVISESNSIIIGKGAFETSTAEATKSVIIGTDAVVFGGLGGIADGVVIIGSEAVDQIVNSDITDTVVIGHKANATASGSVAIGCYANVTTPSTIVLGNTSNQKVNIYGLESITLVGPLTASGNLTGTASYSTTASYALNGGGSTYTLTYSDILLSQLFN